MAVRKNPDGKTATITKGGNLPGQRDGVIAPRKNPLAVPFPKDSSKGLTKGKTQKKV
jgi:hypothetical protein